MIYFIDVNGVLQYIDENGNSTVPYKCIVTDTTISIVVSDGFVLEECQRWNSLEDIKNADQSLDELLTVTYQKMLNDSKPMPEEFARLISENIIDLF